MTKQEEIKIIQSLKGDTYFAQKFGKDIDVMCQNISDDFPIEMGCNFMMKEDALKKALEIQKKEFEDKIDAFAHDILSVTSHNTYEVNKVVEKYIGKDEVIKFKHANNLELTGEELDYLVSKLK